MRNFGSNIPVLVWKELLHFFREPGVRMTFMILPALSTPLLFMLAMETLLLTKSSLVVTPIKTCVVEGNQWAIANPLENCLSKMNTIVLKHPKDAEAALKAKDVDAVVSIEPKSGTIKIKASEQHSLDRLNDLISDAQIAAQTKALEEKNLDARLLNPFNAVARSTQFLEMGAIIECIAAAAVLFGTFCVGGVVTVIFIGEFEHRTIETTLIQPSRHAAIAAKALAASLITMTPFSLALSTFSVFALLLLFISPIAMPGPPNFLAIAVVIFSILTVCFFTALVDMYVAILMRGAKLSVMMMNLANNLILVLGAFSLNTFFHLNVFTAFVPVLNICQASTSILEGRADPGLCLLAYAVMYFYCFIVLLLTEQHFTLEDVMVNIAITLHRLFNFPRRKSPQ